LLQADGDDGIGFMHHNYQCIPGHRDHVRTSLLTVLIQGETAGPSYIGLVTCNGANAFRGAATCYGSEAEMPVTV
jgi:hypothetical protein